jgi:hypothetical protein
MIHIYPLFGFSVTAGTGIDVVGPDSPAPKALHPGPIYVPGAGSAEDTGLKIAPQLFDITFPTHQSSDGGGSVSTSAGGSSRFATLLIIFAGSRRADESRDLSYLAEADVGHVIIPVVSSGNDCDGGCGAGAGARDCTCGVGVFGASLALLG